MVLPYDNMDYGEDQVGARNIPELTDVELTNLANGEILKYNTTTGKWENQPDNVGGTASLDNLTDTNITTPITNGSSLIYNTSNGKWENVVVIDSNTDNLVDLTDTNISSVANNEILKYNSTSSKWENNNLLINEINDVNITSLQNGEVLKYNSSSSKWENQNNTDTLNELTDVTLTGSSNNQVLKYNGSLWVNNFVNLTELADTNIPALNNGDILRYNSVSQKWETDTFNINDLDDVNITSVANNEVLKYNSTSGKWENSNRIDTLDELGDVTLTSVTTGDLLRFNGTIFVNTKIALDNDFTNVNFTSLTNGDLIKYNGTNFINFAPTYLDGAGISDNFLIKVVSGVTTQTSITETNTANSTNISFNNGSIETEIFNTTKKRMHLTTSGIATANGITITSDGRVGIGIVEPEEDLEIDGSIQIDSANVARLKYQKSGQAPHALGEIDGEEDGTNGGDLQFYTKVDGGSVTEKLRINNVGAIGIVGANFGTAGQVLTSNGSGSSVSWGTPITYSAGTGLSLVGTTFNNTAPDQIVTLTQGGSTTITGTYPNFTISSTDTNTTYTAGTGMSLVGTTFNNTAPDQIVTLTQGGSTTITGTYPNFTISSTDTDTTYTAGTGMSLVGTTFNNTAPDQTVTLTQGGSTIITGTYPNFTISSTDTNTTYSAGTGLSLVGTTFNNTSPDQIVTLTQGGSTTITGTYPNFTISSTDTDTTYSAGTGMSLVGTTFSIGQSVATSDSPNFTQMSLGDTGSNQAILNLKDFTNLGTGIIAQIKGIKDGTNGGYISFHTKVDGVDFPTEKIRINNDGAIGIGGANYGTAGQVLSSNGSGSAVSWTSLPPAPLSKVYGTSYLTNNSVNYPTANVYQNIASGTWASSASPNPITLFPHNGTELVKFPRAGFYNISVSCQTLANFPGNNSRILNIQTKVPSGSWVDVKTHDFNDGYGNGNDVVFKYTSLINVVLEITQANTDLRASIYMPSAGRIDGDITGNVLQQKPTSISVFNVD